MPQLKGRLPHIPAKEGLMPQLVGIRRAGWAVFAVAALVASLFVVAVSPGGAVEMSADAAVGYNAACGGDPESDIDFTDVSSGHVHRAAINCLAHYRVTIGTGGGEFSPNDSVTRRQMALFLQRAAGVAGVTLADAVDQGFTDVGSESQAVQDAINQVAAAGMLTGSGNVFGPGDTVTRADMAVAIINLLAQDGASESVARNADGTITLTSGVMTVTVDDAFADVTTTQPRAVDDAVSQLFELGIAKGTSATEFSPAADVTRAQMAAFITRALAFTTARPVGVSIAPVENGYEVSVRDENFEPVINARVDHFYVSGDTEGAFNADGTCDNGIVESEDTDTNECQIDISDGITDGDGNATVTVTTDTDTPTPSADSPLTVWAWTGDVGDEVRQGITELATYVDTGQTVTVDPVAFTVKRSAPTEYARMGSTVTVTIQLVDDATELNNVSQAGYEFSIEIEARQSSADLATKSGDNPLVNTLDDNIDMEDLWTKRAASVTTDESGQATFTVGGTQDRGRATQPGFDDQHNLYVGWTVTHTSEQPITDAGMSDEYVIFADEGVGELATVTAESVGPFNRASGDGATAYIDATVLDQYGGPVAGQAVQLSDPSAELDGDVTLDDRSRYTSRSGTVRLSYERDSGDPAQGMIHAQAANADGTLNTDPNAKSAAVDVIWVTDPTTAKAATGGPNDILTADLTSNAIVVDDTNGPWVVSFDSNDQFVGIEGTLDMAGFAEAIADHLEDDMSTLKLSWRFRSAKRNTSVLWTLSS